MMHKILTSILLLFSFMAMSVAQGYNFEASADHPFGLPNPKAPKQLLDFAPLIGECNCKSVARNPDQTWGDTTDMVWRFKYIMNGMGIQDETLKADGKHSGSIRQYIADSSKWFVHYYSSGSPSTSLPTWEGNKNEDGNILLYRAQKAPNGMDGFYKITFSEMNEKGFNWLGEWVSTDESFSFPTWKISCTRKRLSHNEAEKESISKAVAQFSKAYMNGDAETMAKTYTDDGKIFPDGAEIIEGYEALKKFWTIGNGSKVLHHKITPEEICFIGDEAYDYGYYEGETETKDGKTVSWKGKYVVVWKRVGEDWKMFLDIWNRIEDKK